MIKPDKFKYIKEYIMFNIAGTMIFLICQMVYLFFLLDLKWNYFEANIVSTLVSAVLNYILNSLITFKTERHSIFKFAKIVGLQFFESVPNFIILTLLVEVFKIPEYIAPMIPPVIMTPIIFYLSRNILKKQP